MKRVSAAAAAPPRSYARAIFLLAFYMKKIGGTATVLGAVIGEAAVVWCAIFTNLAWLWWNVIRCVVGVGAALVVHALLPQQQSPERSLR